MSKVNKATALLGASNLSETDRADNDFYATPPSAVEMLLEKESFSNKIWEPAAGLNHITNVLLNHGYYVFASDIIQRLPDIAIQDFLITDMTWDGDIITNPPYSLAAQFVEKAMNILKPNHKLAMLLKLQFLETKGRRDLFRKYPPKTVYVSSSRLACVKNGDFENYHGSSSAVCYAWFVWEKGFTGDPVIKWFNDNL